MISETFLNTLGIVIAMLFLGMTAAVTARALRLSPIVGYIALGLAVRACGIEVFDATVIDTLAQLGVVFLLFDIGLHFSVAQIRERAADIFAFGPVQILIGTLLMGTLGTLFGGAPAAMYLAGATLSLSSTAVVARLIAERHQQNCPVGLTATAILVFQDVAGILLLIVVGSLTDPHSAIIGISMAMAKALLAVASTLLLGKFVIGPFFGIVARTGHGEVTTAAALGVALAGAWLTAQIGLSLTLGAFLGGVSLAETPYRVTIASEVSAFRGLLLGFFFLSVGYGLDVHVLQHAWYMVLFAALGLIALKTIGNVLSSLIFRWSVPGSVQLGMLIAQGSEFGLILLTVREMRSLLGEAVASVLVSAIALTLAATPGIANLGRVLAGKMRRRGSARIELELTPTRLTAPVLIVGMGTVGRTIADALHEFGTDYFAIERDTRRLQIAIADGYAAEYGDGTDTRFWEPVELGHRTVSVLTTPDINYLKATASLVGTQFPNLKRLVIAPDAERARAVSALGVPVIVDSGKLRGLAAAAAVLSLLGRGEREILEWEQRFKATSHRFGRADPAPAEMELAR